MKKIIALVIIISIIMSCMGSVTSLAEGYDYNTLSYAKTVDFEKDTSIFIAANTEVKETDSFPQIGAKKGALVNGVFQSDPTNIACLDSFKSALSNGKVQHADTVYDVSKLIASNNAENSLLTADAKRANLLTTMPFDLTADKYIKSVDIVYISNCALEGTCVGYKLNYKNSDYNDKSNKSFVINRVSSNPDPFMIGTRIAYNAIEKKFYNNNSQYNVSVKSFPTEQGQIPTKLIIDPRAYSAYEGSGVSENPYGDYISVIGLYETEYSFDELRTLIQKKMIEIENILESNEKKDKFTILKNTVDSAVERGFDESSVSGWTSFRSKIESMPNDSISIPYIMNVEKISDGNYKAKVYAPDNMNADLILASYDAGMRLQGLKIVNKDLVNGENEVLVQDKEYKMSHMKFMLWNMNKTSPYYKPFFLENSDMTGFEYYCSELETVVAANLMQLKDDAYNGEDEVTADELKYTVTKLGGTAEGGIDKVTIEQAALALNKVFGFDGGAEVSAQKGMMRKTGNDYSKIVKRGQLATMIYYAKNADARNLVEFGLPDYTNTIDGTTEERFFKRKAELPDEMNLINIPEAHGNTEIYVSTEGNDETGTGSFDAPLKTLEGAVSKAKNCDNSNGIIIYMRGGVYQQYDTTDIESLSGTTENPIYIKAYNNEKVELIGGIEFDSSKLQEVTDEKVLAKIPSNLLKKIKQINVRQFGINSAPEIANAFNGVTVFENGENMTLARYPNDEQLGVESVIDGGCETSNGDVDDGRGFEIGLINDTTPMNWQDTGNIWVRGGFYYEWSQIYSTIDINYTSSSIHVDKSSPFGVKTGLDQYFYYNAMEMLDSPGEYFFDRDTMTIYVYPCSENSEFYFSFLKNSVIQMSACNNVVFEGITIGNNSECGVTVTTGSNIVFKNCNFVNNGARGLYLRTNVTRSGCISCVFTGNCDQNIRCDANGTYNTNLIAQMNFAQNCIFYGNAAQKLNSLVSFTGIGDVISHNLFVNGYATGIAAGTIEGVVEYNEVVSSPKYQVDSGGFYSGGYNGIRATHVRNNYIHETSKDSTNTMTRAIYYDSISGDDYTYGNIIYGMPAGVFNNSGKHMVCYNNIIIDNNNRTSSFLFDNSQYTIDNNKLTGDGSYYQAMGKNPAAFSSYPAWAIRAPYYDKELAGMRQMVTEWNEAGGYTNSENEIAMRTPGYHFVANNVGVNAGSINISEAAKPTSVEKNNFLTTTDPGFVDYSANDFNIKPDSEIYNKIPDFIAPDFNNMGLTVKGKANLSDGKIVARTLVNDIKEENDDLIFRWNDSFLTTDYVLQIAKDAEFKEMVSTFSTNKERVILTSGLPSGTYFWKVTATSNVTALKGQSIVSDTYSFKINENIVENSYASAVPLNAYTGSIDNRFGPARIMANSGMSFSLSEAQEYDRTMYSNYGYDNNGKYLSSSSYIAMFSAKDITNYTESNKIIKDGVLFDLNGFLPSVDFTTKQVQNLTVADCYRVHNSYFDGNTYFKLNADKYLKGIAFSITTNNKYGLSEVYVTMEDGKEETIPFIIAEPSTAPAKLNSFLSTKQITLSKPTETTNGELISSNKSVNIPMYIYNFDKAQVPSKFVMQTMSRTSKLYYKEPQEQSYVVPPEVSDEQNGVRLNLDARSATLLGLYEIEYSFGELDEFIPQKMNEIDAMTDNNERTKAIDYLINTVNSAIKRGYDKSKFPELESYYSYASPVQINSEYMDEKGARVMSNEGVTVSLAQAQQYDADMPLKYGYDNNNKLIATSTNLKMLSTSGIQENTSNGQIEKNGIVYKLDGFLPSIDFATKQMKDLAVRDAFRAHVGVYDNNLSGDKYLKAISFSAITNSKYGLNEALVTYSDGTMDTVPYIISIPTQPIMKNNALLTTNQLKYYTPSEGKIGSFVTGTSTAYIPVYNFKIPSGKIPVKFTLDSTERESNLRYITPLNNDYSRTPVVHEFGDNLYLEPRSATMFGLFEVEYSFKELDSLIPEKLAEINATQDADTKATLVSYLKNTVESAVQRGYDETRATGWTEFKLNN